MADQQSGEYLRSAFGLVIAFIAPGAVAIWGVSQFSPTVEAWFGASAEQEATGAGFLFVLLASLAAGVFISGLRAEVLMRVFGWMGVKRSEDLDEGQTRNSEHRAGLNQAVDDYFKYHLFYGNMAFAVLIAYVSWLFADHLSPLERPMVLVLVLVSVVILLKSAHYSLKRFYAVEEQVLGTHKGETP